MTVIAENKEKEITAHWNESTSRMEIKDSLGDLIWAAYYLPGSHGKWVFPDVGITIQGAGPLSPPLVTIDRQYLPHLRKK